MKIFKKLLISLALCASITTSALAAEGDYWFWTQPSTPEQASLYPYYISLYQTGNKLASVSFYDQIEPLAVIDVQEAYYPIKLYFHSKKTKIGYSVPVNTWGLAYKFMCPDGHSATVKRHIGLAKAFWVPNTYLPRADGTACGSVANTTSIATVQNLYGSIIQ